MQPLLLLVLSHLQLTPIDLRLINLPVVIHLRVILKLMVPKSFLPIVLQLRVVIHLRVILKLMVPKSFLPIPLLEYLPQ